MTPTGETRFQVTKELGTMAAVLRVVNGDASRRRRPPPPTLTDDPPKVVRTAPRTWWDVTLMMIIIVGKYIPPLWPLRWIILMMRRVSVVRALRARDIEGTAENFVARFRADEKALRGDITFDRSCESAVRLSRMSFFGKPVITDWEIEGQGRLPLLRHLNWRFGKQSHPLPPRH